MIMVNSAASERGQEGKPCCSWWASAARSSCTVCGTPLIALGSVLLILSLALILQQPGLPN